MFFPSSEETSSRVLPPSTRNSPASTTRGGLSLIVPLFLFLFLFLLLFSRHLPCFRFSPLSRPLACTAFYHHRRFPLLRLLCRFVSAFAASFCDELIKPDLIVPRFLPEVLVARNGGKGMIWNVVFMKT